MTAQVSASCQRPAMLAEVEAVCAEPGAPAMPGLATRACVTAMRDDGPPSTRHYLGSARPGPEASARAVRSRRVLDVTFDEDAARNRRDNGPENLAIHRRLLLDLPRTARPKLPVSRKRKRSGGANAFARYVTGRRR